MAQYCNAAIHQVLPPQTLTLSLSLPLRQYYPLCYQGNKVPPSLRSCPFKLGSRCWMVFIEVFLHPKLNKEMMILWPLPRFSVVTSFFKVSMPPYCQWWFLSLCQILPLFFYSLTKPLLFYFSVSLLPPGHFYLNFLSLTPNPWSSSSPPSLSVFLSLMQAIGSLQLTSFVARAKNTYLAA